MMSVVGNDTSPASEKREYRRYKIFFPVTIRIGEEEIVGVCRDASAKGVLIAASTPVEPGAACVARFRTSTDLRDERTLEARVVRQELSSEEMKLAFPYCIALEFAKPDPELVADLEARSEQ
jgi:hypothetical protein